MYKVFTHLHACASRAVNLQHTALGAFSELVASAVLEITDAAAWLSLKANKPPHFSINVTKTAWHSPKWARFHCSSREAVDASTVYIERSFEMLASRLQLVFPVRSFTVETRSQTMWPGSVRASQKAALAEFAPLRCFIPPVAKGCCVLIPD